MSKEALAAALRRGHLFGLFLLDRDGAETLMMTVPDLDTARWVLRDWQRAPDWFTDGDTYYIREL